MVLVTLFECEGRLRGFISAGHANQNEPGKDIVCAAVSVLTFTCVNALESVAHVQPIVRLGQGFLAAQLPKGENSHDAQVLLLGLQQGLRDISAQYPNYIRLQVKTESERRKHSC